MKLTKEDYIRLPKERLAELLVEMQEVSITTPDSAPMPYKPYEPAPYIPWYPWGSPITTYTTDGKKVED